MSQRKEVNWHAVEAEYRAGTKTLDDIAAAHGISKGRISQVAKKEGWVRDLRARIAAKADAKLNAEALNADLNAGAKMATEREVVEANAALQVEVRRAHRADIGRARSIANRLLDELDIATEHREAFEAGVMALLAGDDAAGAKALAKATSLPGRVGAMKQLADTLAVLVKLEREAFGIDRDAAEDNGIEAVLKRALTAPTPAA